MNKCWYQLDIDPPVFHKDWVRPTPTKQSNIWIDPSQNVYDEGWIKHVEQKIGLPLGINLTFFNQPGIKHPSAHIDVSTKKRDPNIVTVQNFAINWIDGGRGSEMIWYHPIGDSVSIDVSRTEAGTPYKFWPITELVEIERAHLTGVTLVRTDVPHSINVGDQERWAYSVRPQWNANRLWDQVVEKLRNRKVIKND